MRRRWLVAWAVAIAACKGSAPPPRGGGSRDAAAAVLAPPPPDDPRFAALTRGAIPGRELVGFVPAALGGAARTNLLEEGYSVSAAYQLADGSWVNLEIGNSFRRGGSTREDERVARCATFRPIAALPACLEVSARGARARWVLPDRVVVTLAAPSDAMLARLAEELPLAGLAELSAR